MSPELTLFAEFHQWVYGAILSSARLFPVFMFLPFLNQSTVPALFRFPLVVVLGLSLWPFPAAYIQSLEVLIFAGLLLKELMTGMIMAVFLCFPFWVLHAAGSYIDNQRGATISSSLSPQTGIDSSELANFLNIFAVVIILQAGGMLTFLELMQKSYLLWPPGEWSLPPLYDLMRFMGEMVAQALRIAAPIITVFMVTEVLLGLLARYTPQLNAFSLAMTIKSLVGFAVLLMYMSPIMPSEILKLERFFLSSF